MRVAKVHRIAARSPDDVSGIEAAIAAGHIGPGGVIAVFGKTEGNGLVNDFSRGLATTSLSTLFRRHLPAEDADRICLVMSGGTEGGMSTGEVLRVRAAMKPISTVPGALGTIQPFQKAMKTYAGSARKKAMPTDMSVASMRKGIASRP